MAEKKQLTSAAVEKLRPGPHRREVRDGTRGLILIIHPTGAKSWAMRFRRPGGRHAKLTLGAFDPDAKQVGDKLAIGQPLTLAMARMLAAEVGGQRAHRIDVVADQKAISSGRARKSERSFSDEARRFIDNYKIERGHRKGERPRGWRETGRLLGLDYPAKGGEPTTIKKGLSDRWRDTPVGTIDMDGILDVVEETEQGGIPGIKPRSGRSENRGRHLSAALGTMFKWLTSKRRIAANPFVGMDRPPPSTRRKRLLNFRIDMNEADEVRWFWRGCDQVRGPFGAIAKLLLLTACRRDEIGEMERDELNNDSTMLRLPGTRTKNGLPHDVALSPLAREILEGVERVSNRFVFSTGGRVAFNTFSKKKKQLDAAMLAEARKEKGDDFELKPWRLHDLRRTCASGMGHLKVAPHVVEFCLNHHLVGYNLEAYQDERREALEKWADHVASIVEVRETPGAKVVKLRG
jgi:integrase